ncbi:hypothetical protein C8J56DRAFT_941892 [Mycena floridula]|nr:hypothetical protein C8J56DRAFT_941892 [Mycena floridula]
MEASNPKCRYCSRDTGFEPQTATKAQWVQLKSLLRGRKTSPQNSFDISALLLGVSADIRRCEEEIDRQRGYIVALENQRQMLERHFSICKALTAPVRSTPPEVLGQIFSFFAKENKVSRTGTSIPGLTLIRVCSHWRSVAFSTQSIWSMISVDLVAGEDEGGEENTRATAAVDFLLKHSGARPLTFRLTYYGQDPAMVAGLALVVATCQKWRSLTVNLQSGTLASLLELLGPVRGKLDLLEHLDIDGNENLATFQIDKQALNLFEDTPRLRSVFLRDQTCSPFFRLPWDQILHLDTQEPRCPALVLSKCSQVSTVSVMSPSAFRQSDSELRPLAIVPNLRSLELKVGHYKIEADLKIFYELSLPALQSLSIIQQRQPLDENGSYPISYITTFLDRSQCKLTSLAWDNVFLTVSDWISLLEAMPSLETIKFSVGKTTSKLAPGGIGATLHDMPGRFFERLQDPMTPLLPCLRHLSLSAHYSAIPSGLVDAIESRWIVSNHCDDIACLRSVSLDFPKLEVDADISRALRVLAKSGMKVVLKDSTGFVVG